MNAQKTKWELKDRTYYLTGGHSPLTHKIKTTGILWFDEEQGKNREIRYAINQNSLFVDEQDNYARLGHVIFQDGMLHVPKNQPQLQQLLSVYHPQAGKKWKEYDTVKEATDELGTLESQLEAMNLAKELEIEHLEAIMRTELGSAVTQMSSKELKRDALLFAMKDPKFFVELANDEDIKLRNLANRAAEAKIIKLADDGKTWKYQNGKKIMTVPFDKHPYGALAEYFKTDDGVDLMKSLIKKLS